MKQGILYKQSIIKSNYCRAIKHKLHMMTMHLIGKQQTKVNWNASTALQLYVLATPANDLNCDVPRGIFLMATGAVELQLFTPMSADLGTLVAGRRS